MLTTRPRSATLDDLRALEALPENVEKRFELVGGVISTMNPPRPKHAYSADQFYKALDRYGEATQSGIAFSDSIGYDLPNGDSLIPDASFVSREQVWFPLPDDGFQFAPLVAVEVASPSNSERELLDKAEPFLACGTRLVWIAYLSRRVVDECRRGQDGALVIRSFGTDDLLTADDVLPGFTLAVQDVFPPEGP